MRCRVFCRGAAKDGSFEYGDGFVGRWTLSRYRRAPEADQVRSVRSCDQDVRATATDPGGTALRLIKGAFAAVARLTQPTPDASKMEKELEAQGFRVLAVAVGLPTALKLAGIIALSDPPRPDSAALIAELNTLGVRTVMVTGDAPATAAVVAHAVGLDGKVCPTGPIPPDVSPEDFAVFAGILPEGKYNLVKAFQKSGHTVGMCGNWLLPSAPAV
jgi:H+-transporting ATPase